MSIQQTDKVDLIGVNKETGTVELAILDHLDWSNTQVHLQLLQDKINAYLSFIESGEIYEAYPNAEKRNFKISIIAKYQPNKVGDDFILKLSEFLPEAGYDFLFQLEEMES